MPERPNILLIHSDQHRYDCLGVNGHRQLQTPNLDALARSGMNFTHAFTPSAICTPARASLWTGLWPSRHRCVTLPALEAYHPVDPATPTWGRALADAGYRLGYAGKYHTELTGTPTDHGFTEYCHVNDYAAWRKEQNIPAPERTRGVLGYFGEPDRHADHTQTRIAWMADRTIDMLRRSAASGGPFVVRWDPPEPHLPCLPPEPFASMYQPQSIQPWPSFFDTLENKPYIQRQQRLTWGVQDWTWNDWAPSVAYYLGVISELDAAIGRVLAELDHLGLADHTIVIYTTDHGDFCGGHGMMDKHFCMYDDIMRVPLIVRWPGIFEGGRTCDAFVTHAMDIAATIWRAAGLPPPDGLDGCDLREIVSGKVHRDAVFGQWTGAQLGLFNQRMVRTRRWKYVWNLTDTDELYDLERDPAELVNRVRDPDCAEALATLRKTLYDHLRAIRDPLGNAWLARQLVEGLKL